MRNHINRIPRAHSVIAAGTFYKTKVLYVRKKLTISNTKLGSKPVCIADEKINQNSL
jgi:hypothetical protein